MSDVNTEYFSFQVRVYIGKRNADGSRAPARWVFDASTLDTKQAVSREKKKESWSGQRTTAATMNSGSEITGTLTLGQINTDLAALAVDGQRVDVAAGAVTNELIGDVKAGDVWFLNYAKVSNLELKDGTTPTPVALVENTDYTVNLDLGVVQFMTTKTGVKATAYDYAAFSLATILAGDNTDYYLAFAGLNTVDGATQQVRGELYNVSLSAAETMSYINASFGEMQLPFEAKSDPVRQVDPKWGPYGRLILAAGA